MILPGDVEIDLYRIADGEPIRWRGLSSGAIERAQGVVLMSAGALMAAAVLPEAIGGLALVERLLQAEGGAADVPKATAALFGAVGTAAAVAVAWTGWRMLQTADRVVWAVTSKRLIRMVGGAADKARSWRKADILKYALGSGEARRTLSVTVRSRRLRRGRRHTRTLTIVGPNDLDVAEQALAALED